MTEKEAYSQAGYKHFKSLIPTELIDSLMTEYNTVLLPSTDHYFRQSTQKWEKNSLNQFGYCNQSFLDPHDFQGEKHSKLVNALREIYFHNNLTHTLESLTGDKNFNLMQSMLFDKNTATRPHQDWYYLDSVPKGHLLGVWIALEDINPEAGQFFVLPTTHNKSLPYKSDEKISDEKYKNMVERFVEENKDLIVTPVMKKGDVIIWNSGLIHGASATINSKYSRKSLTAHMMPDNCQFGNDRGLIVNLDYEYYNGRKYRRLRQTYKRKLKITYGVRNYLSNNWPTFYGAVMSAAGKNPNK